MNPATRILSCASANPPYHYGLEEVLPYIKRWLVDDPDLAAKAEKIFRAASIQQRGTVIPIDDVFRQYTFEEKNNLYIEHALALAGEALKSALHAAQVAPSEIDMLVTTSCTGHMIPSIDAHLVQQFGMHRHVQRLPVLQMGCAGGTSALMYADQFLRADAGKKAAIVAVELPSLNLHLGDTSMANVVSSAIFADGAAAAVLGRGVTANPAPTIRASQNYNFPESTGLMGYNLRNSGFHIVLDRDVPETIERHFEEILLPFCATNAVTIEDIDHFIFHPGSLRILESAERLLARHGKELRQSTEVLQAHGNMSSATILFVLEQVMSRDAKSGDLGLMLAFGPGFVGQTVLLEWS